MAKKKDMGKERQILEAQIVQAQQNIFELRAELEKQEIRSFKLAGAIEYHDQLFPPKKL